MSDYQQVQCPWCRAWTYPTDIPREGEDKMILCGQCKNYMRLDADGNVTYGGQPENRMEGEE